MRVRAGIITGLHLQCFESLVQGSELYNSIGTFQSSASARTIDLPTNIPNSCMKVCSASVTNWGRVNVGCIRDLASVDQVHTRNNKHTPVMV